MKLKKLIPFLCAVITFCLLLCGCGGAAAPSAPGESDLSGEQETDDTVPPKPVEQIQGSMEGGDYAGRMIHLTPDSFRDYFHYRMESTDKGGEYDVLTYSVELNASSDDIPCYSEGIEIDVTFDVEIRYAKEYTENGLLYDTCTCSCQVKGRGEALSGTIDVPEVPVFRRSETDTDHKKFTVLNVTPTVPNVAGLLSYSMVNHTYKKAVSFDTVPGFEVTASEDCIAVYMIPKNHAYLYDGLTVVIELRYTYDTTGRPDQFIRYNEERIILEGNPGGYGQYFYRVENGNGKIPKVVVSVISVGGYTVQSKGYTVFDF